MKLLRTLLGQREPAPAHLATAPTEVLGAASPSARWRPVAFDIKATCDPRHQDNLAEVMRPVAASATGWKYLRADFRCHTEADTTSTTRLTISIGRDEVGYLPSDESRRIWEQWGDEIPEGLDLPGVVYGASRAWSVRIDGDPREDRCEGVPQDTGECPECYGVHPPLTADLIGWDPVTLWLEIIKEQKRDKRHDEALAILDKCMRIEEAHDGGVAPWYYEQAAIIRRKCGDREAEIRVLQRFAAQQHAPGAKPPKLLERLAKLEAAM